jgi:hypothetical protein
MMEVSGGLYILVVLLPGEEARAAVGWQTGEGTQHNKTKYQWGIGR